MTTEECRGIVFIIKQVKNPGEARTHLRQILAAIDDCNLLVKCVGEIERIHDREKELTKRIRAFLDEE